MPACSFELLISKTAALLRKQCCEGVTEVVYINVKERRSDLHADFWQAGLQHCMALRGGFGNPALSRSLRTAHWHPTPAIASHQTKLRFGQCGMGQASPEKACARRLGSGQCGQQCRRVPEALLTNMESSL